MNASSIRSQLNLQFAALALVAIVVAAVFLNWQIRQLDDVVQEVALGHQVQDLVETLSVADDGSLQLNLTPELRRFYAQDRADTLFIIRNADGDVLFQSANTPAEDLQDHLTFPAVFDFFPIVTSGAAGRALSDAQRFGLTERVETEGGTIFVTVTQRHVMDEFLVTAVSRELTSDALLIAAPFIVIFLFAAVGIVRYSTRGLSSLSDEAQAIGPENLRARLPVHVAPAEVIPLALAFNDAMDRVADGFDHQKRFTIDAAHQLKTPLAVLRARLESLPAFHGRDQLSSDLDHMDRLVRQLLASARLSVVTIDPAERIDLAALAREVVIGLAPMAVETGKALELEGAEKQVLVSGDAHLAIEALRNLVDNALAHTAPGTTVTVSVSAPATIDVLDRGPGIPPSDRKHILMPFAQGKSPTPGGSGMGLAIASQILQLHGGSIEILDRTGGGSIFSLRFSAQSTTSASDLNGRAATAPQQTIFRTLHSPPQ